MPARTLAHAGKDDSGLRIVISTPETRTAPPTSSPTDGWCPSSSQADPIETGGTSSTQGTTADDGLRASSPLKMP